ncbi:MAG TPA: hypothetical protein QF870_05260, partial [Nitrospinota bacterium]|nr:hypothetical protein [Nitrospinota bacterium]
VLNSLRAEVSPDIDSYKYSSTYYYYGYSEDEEYIAPEGIIGRLRSRFWPFGPDREDRAELEGEVVEGQIEGEVEDPEEYEEYDDEELPERAGLIGRVTAIFGLLMAPILAVMRFLPFGRRQSVQEDDGEPEAEFDEMDPEEAGWAEDDADDDDDVESRTPPRGGRRKSSKTPAVGFLLGVLALAGGWLWQEGYPIPYVKARRTLMEPIRKSAPATKPARWKVTGSALPARDEGARSSNGNARSRSGGPKSPSATRPIGPGSSSP